MASNIRRLADKKLITPAPWLPEAVIYETMMGSEAYGITSDESDWDVYAVCIPPKKMVFPHLAGEIPGFGRPKPRFGNFQAHHIRERNAQKTWDIDCYGIVKYLNGVLDMNPNMVDSLFTPRRAVLYSTGVGERLRGRRREMLHKGAYHRFRGYANSQMKKIRLKTLSTNQKRRVLIEQHGYDTKFAMHLVRLMDECEQILSEGNLDVTRNREQLRNVRAGAWTLEHLETWFDEKEKALEIIYAKSELRQTYDEGAMRELLLECLEEHYGSVEEAAIGHASTNALVREVEQVLERHRIEQATETQVVFETEDERKVVMSIHREDLRREERWAVQRNSRRTHAILANVLEAKCGVRLLAEFEGDEDKVRKAIGEAARQNREEMAKIC